MLTNESKILNEFFMKDLTKLIEKYNKMEEVTVGKLEALVAKVDDNEIKEILMKDLDTTLALVDELGEEVEDDVIQLYFFIKNNIKEINIIEAKAIYEEIALINNTKGERAFYFIGVGSNGKSFTAEVLTTMVGTTNVSNVPLSRFSEKFGTEGLMDKYVNIANKNEIGNAISTENLKIFVSGDRTNIARKYKGDLNYKSTCKMIFLLNRLLDTFYNTHGYYRKILIVPFNKVFKQ